MLKSWNIPNKDSTNGHNRGKGMNNDKKLEDRGGGKEDGRARLNKKEGKKGPRFNYLRVRPKRKHLNVKIRGRRLGPQRTRIHGKTKAPAILRLHP